MARHPSRLPLTDARTVQRRPTLPGVRRAQVPLGRLGDPRAVPPGLEAFAGFEGFQPPGRTTRARPQQGTAPPGLTPIGADDPTRGLGQLGPATGGALIGDSFGTTSVAAPQGVGATGLFSPTTATNTPGLGGFVTPQTNLATQAGRGVQFPGRSTTGGFQPVEAAADRRRPGFSGILPPVPFQSFDDFFAMRRLQKQAEVQEQNPFPFGGGFRFTPEQARIRAAGGDPGESTFIGAPGQAVGPAGGGAGGEPSIPPGPIQQAGSPTGAFGSGGSQRDVEPTGLAGFNAGLLENQAIFAALRDELLRRLIPRALGV